METAIILGAIVQVVTLIVFFVMASNLSKLTKLTKAQLERTFFGSEYYLDLMKEISKIEMPNHSESYNDNGVFYVTFPAIAEKATIHRELGYYSCFIENRQVHFRKKENAIKGLYLHKTGKI